MLDPKKSMTEPFSTREYPLISCIMATRDRQEFIPGAIRCFQAQTYPNLELVVVDHGSDGTDEIVRCVGDERIRYERIPDPSMLTGDVKNRAIANSIGEYVAVWDDDDWHHPSRVTIQLRQIQKLGLDACFLRRVILAWPARSLYLYAPFRLCEGSLLSRRAILPSFGALQRGEDTVQLNGLIKAGRRIGGLDMPDLYVNLIHARNTWDEDHHARKFEANTGELPARRRGLVEQHLTENRENRIEL